MALASKGNQSLREELGFVRGRISELTAQLAAFEGREATLMSQIEPRRERCQGCRGSGRVLTRCCHSGVEGAAPCSYCGGTGQWIESV